MARIYKDLRIDLNRLLYAAHLTCATNQDGVRDVLYNGPEDIAKDIKIALEMLNKIRA